jgi:lipopolysaccharide/colanic/teichoic acid biosynthesis glycosyltransferase
MIGLPSAQRRSQLSMLYPHFLSAPIKRFFDIVVSALGLLLLAPVFVWVGWRIKRDSPGPAFYRGPRVGRGGRNFDILKFRTMTETLESYQGPPVTARDDPRVTSLGRWLRDTKLNELPQLWNVLVGEMSLVGPRPEDPQVVTKWPPEIRQEVLAVRPGITSPASVLYRDEERLLQARWVMSVYLGEIAPDKLRLDQLYVRYRSFWLDLDVLFWTFLVLLPKLGSYKPPEKYLFWGPITRLVQRYINWFIADILVTLAAGGIAGVLWRSFGPLDLGWPKAFFLVFLFALLFSLTGAILGINRTSWAHAAASDVTDLLTGSLISIVIALVCNYLWANAYAQPLTPYGMIVMGGALAFIGFVVVRYRSRLISGFARRWLELRVRAQTNQERVLIIGGGETGQYTAWRLLNGYHARTFRVVGFVDDDLYKQGVRIHGRSVLGQRVDIPALVKKYDVGIIVFAIHNISPQDRKTLLEICESTPARVVLMPNLPGALNAIIGDNGRRPSVRSSTPLTPRSGGGRGAEKVGGEGAPPSPNIEREAESEGYLPCHLCLTKVTPMRVDEWLANLEQLAQSADLAAVQARLRELRDQLEDDVTVQREANWAGKE